MEATDGELIQVVEQWEHEMEHAIDSWDYNYLLDNEVCSFNKLLCSLVTSQALNALLIIHKHLYKL